MNGIVKLYTDLKKHYGDPVEYWPRWCAKTRDTTLAEEILVGAILVARTSWHNTEIALKNLMTNNYLSIKKLAKSTEDELVGMVRPAGFYTTKPKRLIGLCKYIVTNGGVEAVGQKETARLRNELLELEGVGPETADTLINYVFDRPKFVIDEYTRRTVKKMRLASKFDYDGLQKMFEAALPKDAEMYRDFHALIIVNQVGRERAKMSLL